MAKKVTCMECEEKFVPSPAFDFYPDGDDPEIGRCEKCLVAKALSKPSSSPLPSNYEDTVCKRGKGEETCSFLGMTGKGFHCLKNSSWEKEIKQRRSEGSMNAKGDNCSGPPNFTVH
jgi:hypothetical protein